MKRSTRSRQGQQQRLQGQADKAEQHALLLPYRSDGATDVGQYVAEGIATRRLGGIRLIQGAGNGAQQRQAFGRQLRRPGFNGGDALWPQQFHQQAGACRIQCTQPAQLDLAALVDPRPEPLHLTTQRCVMGDGPVTDDVRPQW